MRTLFVPISLVGACLGLYAAAQIVPSSWIAPQRAGDTPPLPVSRILDRASVEQALTNARPPVPWLREYKVDAWVPPKESEPAVAVAVAVAARPAVVAVATAPAPYVSPPARVTTAARVQRAASHGSTELAVTVTP
jgi:hypothetical protein